MRIDKWLWAARLIKTRALAAEAVAGGKVHLNGERTKPAKDIRPGDEVEVVTGQVRRTVVVRGNAERRGPAKEAQLLYEETDASRVERERLAAERRVAGQEAFGARPTKRDRRRMETARARGRR